MATSVASSSDDDIESTVYMDDEEHRATMQRLYHPKKQHQQTTCTNVNNTLSDLNRKSDSTQKPPSFCPDDDMMPHIFDGTESRMSASFNFDNVQYIQQSKKQSASIVNKSMHTVSDKFGADFIVGDGQIIEDALTESSKTSKKSKKRKKSKKSDTASNQQKDAILISRTNSERSRSSVNHPNTQNSAIQSYISNASSASVISNVSSMSQQYVHNHDDNNNFMQTKTKRRRMHKKTASNFNMNGREIPIIRQNSNGINISFTNEDEEESFYSNYENELIPKPRASQCEKQTFVEFEASKAKQPKAKKVYSASKQTKKKKQIEYEQETGARRTRKKSKGNNKVQTIKKTKKKHSAPDMIRASTLNPINTAKHAPFHHYNQCSPTQIEYKRPSSHKRCNQKALKTRYSFNSDPKSNTDTNPTQFSFDTDDDDENYYYDDGGNDFDEADDKHEQTLADVIDDFWACISSNGSVQYEILKITLRVKGVHIAETNYDLMSQV